MLSDLDYDNCMERLKRQGDCLCDIRSSLDWIREALRQAAGRMDGEDRKTLEEAVELAGLLDRVDLSVSIGENEFFRKLFSRLKTQEKEELKKLGINIKKLN